MRRLILILAASAATYGCDDDDTRATAAQSDSSGSSGGSTSGTTSTTTTTTTEATTEATTESMTSGTAGEATTDTGSTGDPASMECVEYCAVFLPNCNEIAGVMAYDDEADCLTTCATFSTDGTPGGFVGDSVQCRFAHMTFDPNPGAGYWELHCFHAQEQPADQCVGPPV